MTDYAKLIDAETWAFIERTNSYYPPDTIDYTIAQQREIYDRLCREFFAGYPDGVAAETTAIAMPGRKIPIRVYRSQQSPTAVVLYLHGGGFILGGLDSHDDICAELCARTGYEVVSVDYRLAPEHVHPAAYDDALAAFEWAATTYTQPIVLCGDSAGGNLAAAIAHATRGHARKPVGQMLIYPALGGDMTSGSYIRHAKAPMLTVRDLEFYEAVRTGGRDRAGDITLSPLTDVDFQPAAHRCHHRRMRPAFIRRRGLSRPHHLCWRKSLLAWGIGPRAWLSARPPHDHPRARKLHPHYRCRRRVGQARVDLVKLPLHAGR
jgi:acetyl esterase